jgi:hypothetical protein
MPIPGFSDDVSATKLRSSAGMPSSVFGAIEGNDIVLPQQGHPLNWSDPSVPYGLQLAGLPTQPQPGCEYWAGDCTWGFWDFRRTCTRHPVGGENCCTGWYQYPLTIICGSRVTKHCVPCLR